MSLLVQDLIVSVVAFAAVTAIGVRARAMFASRRSGPGCGSCTKCPATTSTLPAVRLDTSSDRQARMIRLTVIPASSQHTPHHS